MRIIDADALLEELKKTDRYFMLKADIDNAPTVEYPFYQEAYQTGYEEGKNERPRGEWISNNIDNSRINRGRHCSICNYIVEFSTNYCPSCGAYMIYEETEYRQKWGILS